MCGIAGILRFDGEPVDEQSLARMSRRIAHRGPDDAGTFIGSSVGLAHRRLSILDLTSAARQPMWDAGRTAAICYNGEVYNYKELRDRLVAEGHAFHSTGDTEVLLRACMAWGVFEAARQVDGMFAFAYWDERRQELWLARDRMGIKPLYCHRTPERVLIASEIKALLGEIEPELDESTLMALLMPVPLHDPHTLFRGIQAVEPGQVIRIRTTGQWEPHAFFSLGEAVDADLYRHLDRMPDDRVVATMAGLVERSVVLHLASDASVGTLASGGLDSSLISYLSRQHLPHLAAYHADVTGPLSELKWAQAFARHAGLPLHVAALTPEAYIRTLPRVTHANEWPVGFHPNTVPFYLVCRLAAQDGIKVLMTGEGADELFGGYATFRWNARRRRLETWKAHLTRALARLGLGRLGRLLDRLTESDSHYGSRSRAAALLTRGQSLLPIHEAGDAYAFISQPIEREFQMDLFVYLHSYLRSILWRNDRMGMAVGLESRVPYLDNELIRYAVNLPMRFKLRGATNKWVLRRVADNHLPPMLSRRQKCGFPVDAQSYVRPSWGFFREGFLESQLKIGARQLQAFSECHPELHFHLAMAEIWGQIFFQGGQPDEVAERLWQSVSEKQGLCSKGPSSPPSAKALGDLDRTPLPAPAL